MKKNSNGSEDKQRQARGRGSRGRRKVLEQAVSIGIDLGDRRSRYCALNEAGEVIEEGEFANTRAGIERLFAARSRTRVALETGGQSGWIAREISGWGQEVLVANARELRGIWGGPRKNDRRDAEKLARYARLDPKLLHPTRVRSAAGQRELSRLRVRDALVRTRTLLVNTARGLSKAHGERIGPVSTKTFARRARASLSSETAAILEPLLEQIEALSARIAEADRAIEQAAKNDVEAARLTTVHGVGALTALTFVRTLEDPGRFRNSRDVGAYLGLTPGQAQSGERDPQLGISKAGDVRLRRLLVQCAHYILGPFGRDSALRRWGLELARRGGVAGRNRAVIAVARKLAVMLHRMWVRGENWRPFPAGA